MSASARSRVVWVRRTLGAVALALALVFAGPVSGQTGPSLDALRSAVAEAEESEAAAQVRLENARAAHARQTDAVDALKEAMDSPFDVYALRAGLRGVQEAADRLAVLDEDARAEARAAAEAESALAVALRARVQALNAVLRTPGSDRGAAIAELNALNAELGRLAVPLPTFSPVPIDAIVHGAYDTPEDMYDAAAELADAAARIERQLEDLREQLTDAQARARLFEASGEFAAEESLLDDDGARRVGNRGGTSGAPVEDADNQAGGTPTGTPTVDMGQAETPTDAAAPPETDGEGFEGGPSRGDGVDPGNMPGTDDDVQFGAGSLVPPTPTAEVIRSGRANADETQLLDGQSTRSGRRGRGAVETLREHESALLRELEAVRAERARLTEGARAMERGE